MKPTLESLPWPSSVDGLDGAGLSNSDLFASWASAGAGEGRDLLGWAGLAFSRGKSSGVEMAGQSSRLENTCTAGGGLDTSVEGPGQRLRLSSTNWLNRPLMNSSESTGAPTEVGNSDSRNSDSDVPNFSSSFDGKLDLGLNNLTRDNG